MQRIVFSSLILLCASTGFTQKIPLETWRTHFSYRNVRLIELAGDKIFCAVENGLFSYDLADFSINKITKLSGLSDVDITAMSYCDSKRLLVIGYSSGGIDLVTETEIYTINDVKLTNLVEDKTIKDIRFWKDNVLVATSLGIIVISTQRNEITENFRSIGLGGTDVSVDHLYVKGDSLFAITNQGIQTGNLNNNLLDFTKWYFFPETQNKKHSFFGSADNQLFSIRNDTTLITLSNIQWVETTHIFPEKVVATKEYQNLLLATKNAIFNFDGSQISEDLNYPDSQINDFLFTEEYWVGTNTRGLDRINSAIKDIHPNGPLRDDAANIVYENGQLYILYGPPPESYTGSSDQLGYDVYNGKEFRYSRIDGFYDLSDVAYWNGKTYFSSVGSGIYIQEDNQVLDHTNSSLSNSKNGWGPMISDLEAADKLWVTSYNSPNPIISINDEGMTSYPESIFGNDSPSKIISTGSDLVLIQKSSSVGGGITAFDPPNSIKSFSTSNGLPSNDIRTLMVDIEDVAWVGTADGLITFPDASFIIDFSQPVQPSLDNTFLFEDDDIRALSHDGGNRLWISTDDGLWVFNSSFTEIDHFFTSENSPLPTNEVTNMAYHDQTGEMFIQTTKGLVSFRSSSSAGKESYAEVSIFPNPVRPGYSGLVGITGLLYDTTVKITNINGKLVRQLETNGGTASWDLLDYNNQRVSSGVYIVFTATSEGNEKFVGKIAVVN